MINFDKLKNGELEILGIAFRTAQELDRFAEIIVEELQVRIGHAMSEACTPEQIKEVDQLEGDEAAHWVHRNVPNCRDIVNKEKLRLEQELLEYRSQIPGAVPILTPDIQALRIEEVDAFPLRCRDGLWRLHIKTIGEILDCDDLSKSPRLTPKNIKDIYDQLWKMAVKPMSEDEEDLWNEEKFGDDDDYWEEEDF